MKLACVLRLGVEEDIGRGGFTKAAEKTCIHITGTKV